MSEYEAIRRLLAEYCQLCDDEHFAAWAQLFTADGTFTAFGRTHRGHAALEKFIASTPVGKHLCFNAIIDIDADSARCACDFLFIRRDRSIQSAGRYIDRLVREGGSWRFAERSVDFFDQ